MPLMTFIEVMEWCAFDVWFFDDNKSGVAIFLLVMKKMKVIFNENSNVKKNSFKN